MSHEGIELPRLVKKAGGFHLRVDTLSELDAALADGWCLKTPPPETPTGIVLTDALGEPYVPAEPFPDVLDDADGTPPEAEADGEDAAVDAAPPKRGPGRPRKGG